MIETTQLQYDIAAGKILSVYLISYSLHLVCQGAFKNLSISNYSIYLLGIIFVIMILKNINYIGKSFNDILVGEFTIIGLLVFSLLRYDGVGGELFSRCIWTIAFCVPFYGIFRRIHNTDIVFQQTRLAVILVSLLILFLFMKKGNDAEYDMNMGYTLLFPVVFSIKNVYRKKIYVIIAILDLYIIVSKGSRGPLVCVGVFLILLLLCGITESSFKNTMLRVMGISLLCVFLFFSDSSLSFILRIVEKIGITGRTVQALSGGMFWADSGRSMLRKIAIDRILEKPVWGWGIAGDIVCMEQYPHFIFIEIILDFGLIFGTLICAVIIYKIIRVFFICKLKESVWIMLLCCGLLPLFMSHSYLQEPLFWVFMGVSTSIVKGGLENDT